MHFKSQFPIKMKSKLKYGIIFSISIVLIVAGLCLGILWPSLYNKILNNELTLTPTSSIYEIWKETPIPMYLKFYMFNCTNPESLNQTNGEKPNFVEMGPYVFREVDYKINEKWNDNNSTITFQRRKIWTFEESLSNGSLSDNITNLNAVAASVAYSLRFVRIEWRDLADRVMRALEHELTNTRTVRELLFDGYKDSMLLIAQRFNISKIPFTNFGWFYDRNGSDTADGTFNMYTGVSNRQQLGLLSEWNFKNKIDFNNGECGTVTGSLGDLWPELSQNETVSVFVSDICTSLKLTYENETTMNGLTGRKYISDYTMLDNGTRVPERKCFLQNPDGLPTGMLNVSRCKYDAPAFISSPHFYLADPSYTEYITGMKPDKDLHEMSIAVEPDMGVPLSVHAKLQLNLMIQPDDAMTMFKNVKKTFVPMLWFVQETELTAEYASKIKFLSTLSSLGSVSFYGIAAIGFLIFFIGVFLFMRQKWRNEDNQVLLSRDYNHGDNGIHG